MPLSLSEIRRGNAAIAVRGPGGKFAPKVPETRWMEHEVATVQRAEFLYGIPQYQYPNFSAVIQHRSQGQGIKFYDTMLATDADLSGFFQSLIDDVLHYPWYVRPASGDPEHMRHKQFIDFALRQVPHFQNVLRNVMDAYARGYSVTEKIFTVADRGEWRGAVIYSDLLDKPQRWFGFDMDRNLRFKTYRDFYPGELVPQEKFMVVSFGTNSAPWGEPVLDLCYWAWYLKHHAMKNQALWFEKWASPTPMAQYRQGTIGEINAKRRREALEAAMSFQSDQAVAIPEGIKLELLESNRSGAISFESYILQLTEMESRIVTGQILTSMIPTTGSYAAGKVHARQQSNKVETLAKFMDSQISRHLVRDLIDRNFGPQEVYPRFETLAKSALERQADAQVDTHLMINGLSLSRAWANQRYQNVEPLNAADTMVLHPTATPGQELPVNPTT